MAAWLETREFTVFGTLKFTNGHSISEQKAEPILRKFFNKLDKLYLGPNLVAAGHRIERAVFMHTGTSRSNLHYHFMANPAKDIGMFCETARCVWDETSSFTMGYENTLISDVRSLDRTASYCVHEYQTHGADTLHLSTTHQKKAIPTHNPIYAMRRMLKRQQQNELIKEPAWMQTFLR